MNNQKEIRERSKENRENHHHHQKMLLAPTSMVCNGAFEMALVYDAGVIIGATPEQCCDWVRYMDQVGWLFKDTDKVNAKNFRRSLRMWYEMAEKVERQKAKVRRRSRKVEDDVDYEAQKKEREEKKRTEKAKDPREWEMCKERCANCLEGGGCPAFRVPPQLREWPLNAEECPGFARREDYHGC